MRLRNDNIIINNEKINYIIKDEKIYLSKKEIIKLFGINKSELNNSLLKIKEQNSELYFKNTSKIINTNTKKIKKYYSLNILISLGYRFKLYSGVKLLISINNNIKYSQKLNIINILKAIGFKYYLKISF